MIRLFIVVLALLSLARSGWSFDSSDPPPITVYVLAGQSNMEGHGQIRSLDILEESSDGARLLKEIRAGFDNVTVIWAARVPRSGPLRPGWGMTSNEVGPELGFGAVMADRHSPGQAVLVKTAWGGKDVFCDFRSPSAGEPAGDEAALLDKERAAGNQRVVGASYRLMIEEIRTALADIPELVPGYIGQPVILAGFAWFQGWNDLCRWHERDDAGRRLGPGIIEGYARNLAAMIRDLRRDLDAPNLPVVIGELGIGGEPILERAAAGNDEARALADFRQAQRGVLDEPGMARVYFVPTARFWDDRLEELREMKERYANERRAKGLPEGEGELLPTPVLTAEFASRGGHWYCHYNGSAANYVRVGAALAIAFPRYWKEVQPDGTVRWRERPYVR